MKNCPNCKVSLLGEPIPEEHREKHYGGATHFKREIYVKSYSEDYSNKKCYYQCPDCNHTWGSVNRKSLGGL